MCQPPMARGTTGRELAGGGWTDGGSCGHRKRKELRGGICWEGRLAPPLAQASCCHPGRLGGTRLGLRGNTGGLCAQTWVGHRGPLKEHQRSLILE